MKHSSFLIATVFLGLGSGVAHLASGDEHHGHDPHHDGGHGHRHAVSEPGEAANWYTGAGVELGGVIFPHIHVQSVWGGTTADDIGKLASGHHDPQSTGTLQALEPAVSFRLGEYLRGFATYSATYAGDGGIDGEWEEAFGKLVELPGGFEIRGGRFLNKFGFQNAEHTHGWDFVNQNLMNGRLLQEGELITDGIEMGWDLPTVARSAVSISYGFAPSHQEEHEHGEGEGEEPEFEGEGARIVDDIFGANYSVQIGSDNGINHRAVVSGAWGENAFGETTQIYGMGHEIYRKGSGSSYFRLRNEAAYRQFEAVDPDGVERRDFDEIGFYSMVSYGFDDTVEAGLRLGYVSGIGEAELDERWRVSPNVTFSINPERTLHLRLQYDYDRSSEFGEEHSVWAQMGFSWGGEEVR